MLGSVPIFLFVRVCVCVCHKLCHKSESGVDRSWRDSAWCL